MKFQTIHSSKFLVNKQNGNKLKDIMMILCPTLVLVQQHVVTFWTHTHDLHRSLGQQQEDYNLAMLIVIFSHLRRWILDEIFIDTDFLVSLLFFRVRILSEKKRTVSKFSDEVVSLRWFKPNAFASSLW